MSIFHFKKQWLIGFRNEGQFVHNNTKDTIKGNIKISCCTYIKKVGWH